MKISSNPSQGEKKRINSELWQSCAGPLVNLPSSGTHVLYFPQGHSEQVAASMKKDVDSQIPNYPNLPSKLLCMLHNVTLHADPETDEVYAQMTLQPVPSVDKEALMRSDISMRTNKPQTEFFCKTLTASDTSTHGGFSVPRRAAEKIFPPLDFSMQPPAQELRAKDLHDIEWTFRHIYRGQPKRHLLTTGWSLFVSGKRLLAGDSVLFIRDEKQQLLLGIRRANRQPTNLSSSVLSSDSMHIGILAAAAHAAANSSPFTVFFNPRTSPSEFVISVAKYYKAVCSNQISSGMRFRMMFETEESGTRRYMGTITSISDLDPLRWKNSQWRNLQVGWDESTTGEKRSRVSLWDIEPIIAPFFFCPAPFTRSKYPRQSGFPGDCFVDEFSDMDNLLYKRTSPWHGDEMCMKDPHYIPGLNLAQWFSMQQTPSFNSMQPNYISGQLGFSAPQIQQQSILPPGSLEPPHQVQQLNQLGSIIQQPQKQPSETYEHSMQNLIGQTLPSRPSQVLIQNQNILMNSPPNQQHPQILGSYQSQNPISDLVAEKIQMSDAQIQLQLQKIQQQQKSHFLEQHLLPHQQISVISPQHIMSHQQTPDMSQPHVPPQMSKCKSRTNGLFSYSAQQQPGVVPELPCIPRVMLAANQLSTPSSNVAAGGIQSGITDDIPSCSTSPSTNNFTNGVQSLTNRGTYRNVTMSDDIIIPTSVSLLNPSHMETMNSASNAVKVFPRKYDVKPSLNMPTIQTCANGFGGAQMDYTDMSSSTTSANLFQNNSTLPFCQQSMLFKDTFNSKNNVRFEANMDVPLGSVPLVSDPLLTKDIMSPVKEFSNDLTSEDVLANLPELTSSMVSQSFGVPDMTFNSIESSLNDGSFMNRELWASPHQLPRMRTFTKVYKRGAVGRSIDIARYSGYDDLKHDLARRFGIEGQLEDQTRVGWKLVYMDHENDVLLVGDDPWEEFVNCVRCIRILSPQEVQNINLVGNFGNNVVPNQACSSLEGMNV